jgi:isocitrate dehydrogenase
VEMPHWADEVWHHAPAARELVGVDLFLESGQPPAALAASLQACLSGSAFTLKMLSNRGTQVWPPAGGHSFLIDHFQARLLLPAPTPGDADGEIAELLGRLAGSHRWMHLEKLQRFDGRDAYAKAQGEG